jgi:hypothetical protein
MTEHTSGYAVFLYDQAIEALGEPIKAYMMEGPTGPYIGCHAVDTAGAFVEMTVVARNANGEQAETELIVPTGMVRMIVSSHSESVFGFAARHLEPGLTALPVVGPQAPDARTPSTATPHSAPAGAVGDRREPPEG